MADENTFFEEDGARASRQAELNPLLPEVAVRMREVFRELTAILTRYHGGDPQWLAPDRQGEADLCRDAPNDRSLARWDMNVAKTRAEYPREVYEADLPEVLA